MSYWCHTPDERGVVQIHRCPIDVILREAVRIHLGLEDDLVLNEEEMEENKSTIKKVMDINKCVSAFLAEQEPNEKQVSDNYL